jgi:hypothetical protein
LILIDCCAVLRTCIAPALFKEFTLHTLHSADVIPLGSAKSRVASELLISAVLQLISRHGALANADAETTLRSAAAIERHLKTLAGLPDMEPILRATCQQLSEQWGMLLEQQRPKATPATFITRVISGPRQHRTN